MWFISQKFPNQTQVIEEENKKSGFVPMRNCINQREPLSLTQLSAVLSRRNELDYS
jgi:hypothetical protein